MSKTERSDGSRLIAAQQEMGDALLPFAQRSFLRAFATHRRPPSSCSLRFFYGFPWRRPAKVCGNSRRAEKAKNWQKSKSEQIQTKRLKTTSPCLERRAKRLLDLPRTRLAAAIARKTLAGQVSD